MSVTYEITTDPEHIVIRLPRASADPEALAKLLDYLELESIRRRSQLSADEAAGLAAEVKRGAWQRVRHLFETR